MSDREDVGGRDQEGWYPHPGEWFPPPIVPPPGRSSRVPKRPQTPS